MLLLVDHASRVDMTCSMYSNLSCLILGWMLDSSFKIVT